MTKCKYFYLTTVCRYCSATVTKFDSVWRWVHVKRTSEGLWHTPAASLGSRLCGTGLLVPVQAGRVLVGGAGRWLAGEGAGRNVEHWEKEELVYFRNKRSPNSLRMYWNISTLTGCAGVSVLGTFVNVVNIIHSKLSWLHPLPARRPSLSSGWLNEWCLCCDRCNTSCLESSNQQSSQEEEPPPRSWSSDYPPTLLAHGRLLENNKHMEVLQICYAGNDSVCVLEGDFVFIFNLNTKEVKWYEREMGRKQQVTAAAGTNLTQKTQKTIKFSTRKNTSV